MSALLLAVSVLSFGGCGDGVADNSAALNAAVAAAQASDREVTLPLGYYNFTSQPGPLNGVTLRGVGMSTVLRRSYSGNFLTWQGQSGGGAEDLIIVAAVGTSGGVGLRVISDNAGTATFLSFRNVVVSGEFNGTWGTWAYPLEINGGARTIPPLGVRDVSLDNVSLFNGTSAGAWLYSAIGVRFSGGIYPGGGTNADVYVMGTGETYSSNVVLSGFFNGTLQLCNAWNVYASGTFGGLFAGCGGGSHVIIGPMSGANNNQLASVLVLRP